MKSLVPLKAGVCLRLRTNLVAVVLTLLLGILPAAAQKKILFYGSTHEPGGVGETLVNSNPAEFHALGQGSAIWTPGDPDPAKDWSMKTLADFQAFDAIVIGDRSFVLNDPAIWTGAIANRTTWSAAVSGNILLYGEDPEFHAFHAPGAVEMIQQGIRFAADGTDAGPGLFISFSTMNPDLPSPVDPMQKCTEHLLSGLGIFKLIAGHHEQVRKIYSNPVTDCLTEGDLSNWGESSHSGFHDWPVGYVPLAMVTDVPDHNRTPSSLLPPGESGLVHLLAKGNFKRFFLTPAAEGRLIGQQHTVTANYLSETGSGISGATVVFNITSGPNIGLTATRTTGTDGKAVWTYTGNGGTGRDVIEASATGLACPPSARAFCDWAPQVVTIVATDPTAAEPPTQGGQANTGAYSITRSGNTSQALTVFFTPSGTAIESLDFNFSGNSGHTMHFNASQTVRTLTVVPLFDTLSEVSETVVVKLLERLHGFPEQNYAVGSPGEATVNIASAQNAAITVSVVDGTLDETGNNPGLLRIHRSYSVGSLQVSLEFTGTATFGSDYVIGIPNFAGTVDFNNGVSTVDLPVDPVPDSRAEGSAGETVIVSVLPSPDGSYSVGNPSSQTVTILENDSVQFPANGWKLTEIFSASYPSQGFGLNTIPDGAGGWRAQAVGVAYNYGGMWQAGFKWDNGTIYNLSTHPSFWNSPAAPWSAALSINDNGTSVGNAGYYTWSFVYDQRATYWHVGQTYPSLLTSLYTDMSLENTATDINQRDPIAGTGGIIVGNQANSFGKIHAVAWIPDANGNYGLPTQLWDVGDGFRYSYANAINEAGVVVGNSQTADSGGSILGFSHAFRSKQFNGVPQPLIPDDDMGTATFVHSHFSEANDINELEELVGASQFPSGQYRAAYKAPGTGKNQGWFDLGVLGEGTSSAGTESVALSINDKGLIVGKSLITIGSQQFWRAFVVSNEGDADSQPMLNLAEHSWVWTGRAWQRADANGWVFLTAERINRENWIVGYGQKGTSDHRAFLLSPR